MDAELLELQRQFEFAQQAKSSVRLSERNVVELVRKLQELHIIDFDLLYTVSGKEYITPDRLRHEMEEEICKSGRVSLIDLSDVIGVDLYHVEKQAQQLVADSVGLVLIQGEIISQSYWDTVAEDINERLQECSQIAVAELAAQLHISSELATTVLEARLGTIIKGRLEGGQLYTPAYVARVTAMVCGAARGITVPTNLSIVWSSLKELLLEMDGASGVSVEAAFFQSLFNGLVKDGEILGSLRAGVHWTPAVFAQAQKESVDSLFSQNSYITYDVLRKLAISQPKHYLQSRYPEGIPLDTVFIHPSMIEMLDTAIEDAIQQDSWIDSLSLFPVIYGGQDASKLLSYCPSVQRALKSNKATILGESFVLSSSFLKDLFDRIDKEAEVFNNKKPSVPDLNDNSRMANEQTVGHDSGWFIEGPADDGANKNIPEKGSKKKRGKATGSLKIAASDYSLDDQEIPPAKAKKNQRKNKDTNSLQLSDAKGTMKRGSDKSKDENQSVISEEWIIQKLLLLFPDLVSLRGQDDPDTLLRPLAIHLRPILLTSWKERRKTLFMESAEKRKRLLDDFQKKLDEAFLDLQLYEKAIDLFEDDPSTSVVLHKHLLRTTATPIMNTILLNLDIDNKLKNGIEVEESQNVEPTSLVLADRIALAKSLSGSLSAEAIAANEALEGKHVVTFVTALEALAERSGLHLKKLDKKLERTLLHSYRKDLTSQVSSEADPVALLPEVVSLLYLQMYNKALQAPGKAIAAAVSRLKNKLGDSAHQVLVDYHTATVTLLALLSTAAGDEEDCTSDRILSKRELLEGLMPELKALVINTS